MTAIVALVGHVDHGKSALVHALSGAATDRLANEAAAGHTIEVNAAHVPTTALTLLDVPGHRDWTDAALAGLGAATHALVVVAADDGVMPQTRDHLVAVAALGVPLVAVAITKADRRPDRVSPVGREVAEELGRHGLAAGAIVATSTRDGTGLARLASRLTSARAPRPRPPLAGPDLWIDRAFVVAGRGPVVIGTLRCGTVAEGDLLVEATTGRRVRVRGLQHRGETVREVSATDRVAVRVDDDDLHRGSRLVAPAVHADGLLGPAFLAEVAPVTGPVGRRGAWLLHVGTTAVAVDLRTRGFGPGWRDGDRDGGPGGRRAGPPR